MNRRGPIIAAIAAVLVAVLVVVLLLLPKASAVHKKQDELEAAQRQEQQLEAQLEQLQDAKARARQARRELARLETRIPPTADLPSLVRFVQGAADASAVDFMSIAPSTPTASANQSVSIIPTQITTIGTFFSVEEFMFKLETLPRAVKVTQIQVGPGPNDLPQLQISMTVEVYTTDASAGPGSVPGPTKAQPTTPASPSPSPGG